MMMNGSYLSFVEMFPLLKLHLKKSFIVINFKAFFLAGDDFKINEHFLQIHF